VYNFRIIARETIMTTPKDILKQWLEAVNKGDILSLLGLYDSQAVLIPTFSNRLLNNPSELKIYFEELGTKKKLSVSLHEETLITQSLQNEIYLLSGVYSWCFVVDGKLQKFEARFSYLIDLLKPNPILQHHSSQLPSTISML
jgi:hypothetical protein